ncbi:hypothetical protein ADIS_0756 [Lunatimonas lonarensis]|uniref:M23ase beta-sheet core domain-containing protein n=1 Tax=Lunatimonas lonarensis TaxID=1232681 RepID=R7ZXY4_9BACT|nr:peptidoglycan DD-metalloendopeptidase family protein [Lunatimonas lonarensis]EON78859.1 hypothetical protein ADIS_0756 [Lunatimonas lonarensis]
MSSSFIPPAVYPLMGTSLVEENAFCMDLSMGNPRLSAEVYMESDRFVGFIAAWMATERRPFALGGYLENRVIYSRSEVFALGTDEYRNIHLGVDIWAQVGMPIFCPFEGQVHSFHDNRGLGNYGPTVILEHWFEGKKFHSLYGHLQRSDLSRLEVGQPFQPGDCIGHLGAPIENGNWPPHLHIQLIVDMEGYLGDYPGVCRQRDLAHYRRNCPDPNHWIQSPLLLR